MLSDLLRAHDGVLTLEHARLAGLSKDAVRRRVQWGFWRRCSPGVYFVDDRPFGDAARIRAAVWSYGDNAVASGLAAAWWLRVTAVPLTVIEAATRKGGGAKLLDSALQRDVELGALWRAQLRNKGRYGSPAARRLLHAADGGARSAAERIFLRLLQDAGITGWKANHPVAGFRVDVAFPELKVAIEIDGLAFHSDAEDFQHDRSRQNAIALAGWQVLRFTWLDLTEYPDRVIAVIRAAISAC